MNKLALPVLLLLGACHVAAPQTPTATAPQAPRAHPRPWEHESSDLTVNPRIHFGHFDNGMRFAWMRNSEPKERCYLRLHIDAGSLCETEEERGMAHFLEHMCFNGSRNFPPGALVQWLQNHGMQLGPDSNAFTSYGQTVYMLDLPHTDEESIRDGLRVLRDYADGVTFAPVEVESEKGVIDGEERESDSAARRLGEKNNAILLDGTRIPSRDPIGLKAKRDKFTPEACKAFYARWYRPENATLVLVGDIGDLDPSALFETAFADWKAIGPHESEPAVGTPTLKTPFFSIEEKEIPYYVIGVNRMVLAGEHAASSASLVKHLPEEVARAMLGLRFLELAKKKSAEFLQAVAFGLASEEAPAPFPKLFEGEAVQVVSTPEKWKEALAQCEQELRRALEHGFQPSELDEVRARTLRQLEEGVKRESTRPSTTFAGEILNAAESRRVPIDAATRQSIVKPALEALTVEKCQAALASAWNQGTLLIGGAGNLDLGEQGGASLREVWEQSRKTVIEAGAKIAARPFAYPSGEKGASIAHESTIEDLGIHRLEFRNGVRVAIKKTDFKEHEILLAVALGEGELTLEPARTALGWVASRVFEAGGLEAHTQDDVRRLSAGKQVGLTFLVAPDAFGFGGPTTAEDLRFECELVCAHIQHPGWRDEGLDQLRKVVPEMYASMEHELSGPLQLSFLRELYSGDPRFGMPSREEIDAVTLPVLKDWLTPELAEAPLSVCVVGDLDVAAVKEAVARTFGVLPERRAPKSFEDRRKIEGPLAGLRSRQQIDTQVQTGLTFLAFPTTDGRVSTNEWNLDFLAKIVSDRLFKTVREKLGAAYSPSAFSECSSVFPGDGMIGIQTEGDPTKMDALVDACFSVTDALAKDGVTQEEVDRLREPALAQWRDAQRRNGYWAQTILDGMHVRPAALDDARHVIEHLKSVKAEDLTPLAKRYLAHERASVLVVTPKPIANEKK